MSKDPHWTQPPYDLPKEYIFLVKVIINRNKVDMIIL